MNVGKTLFAQVMEFVPLKTFGRIIDVAATHHVESTRLHGQDVQHNTSLPALTIAALYKSRWQVELFFKWIKQHLRIKRFLGTSENTVKTQIWALCPPPYSSPLSRRSFISMLRSTHVYRSCWSQSSRCE